jgi:hypothetical protein
VIRLLLVAFLLVSIIGMTAVDLVAGRVRRRQDRADLRRIRSWS